MALFKCESCGFTKKLNDDNIGKSAKCPKCKTKSYVKSENENNLSEKEMNQPPNKNIKNTFREIFVNLVVAIIIALGSFFFITYNREVTQLQTDMTHVLKNIDKIQNDLQNVQKNLGGTKNPSGSIHNIIENNISDDKGLNQLYNELNEEFEKLKKDFELISHKDSSTVESDSVLYDLKKQVRDIQGKLEKQEGIISGLTSGRYSQIQRHEIPILTNAEKNGFTFQATSCERKKGSLYVTIRITNNHDREEEFKIYIKDSFIIDNFAQQFIPNEMKFGAISDDYSVRQNLPPNIPMNAIFLFRNIPNNAKSVSLRIECYTKTTRRFSLTLSKIVING